jgi:hypothetical protein
MLPVTESQGICDLDMITKSASVMQKTTKEEIKEHGKPLSVQDRREQTATRSTIPPINPRS